ncbi:hypothetical protein C8R47DRAFT_1216440 [Mycena vitilis]|nr:hypothetical protein C8R47DRAFT_1216440 [Mycena vitilis]
MAGISLHSVFMQHSTFKTRAVYQNTPASNCQELGGVCVNDARVILIFIVIFVVGLLLLTLAVNFRASCRKSREDHAAASEPPPYSSIGLPPSPSGDLPLYKSVYKSGAQSPSLDPYHVVAPSFDSSLLLRDEYFDHVPYPERSLAPVNQQRISGPAAVTVGSCSTTHAPRPPSDMPLVAPPPAYARSPLRRYPEDPL